jgi:hypothetical protein
MGQHGDAAIVRPGTQLSLPSPGCLWMARGEWSRIPAGCDHDGEPTMSRNTDRTLRTAEAATGATTELGQAIHELVGHQIDLHEFARRFLVSRVYALCPVVPGPFVMSRPGKAAIAPVWSTTRALRRVMGNCDWLACTGEDLVVQLPAGVEVLIDAGMPFPVVVPSGILPPRPFVR